MFPVYYFQGSDGRFHWAMNELLTEHTTDIFLEFWQPKEKNKDEIDLARGQKRLRRKTFAEVDFD